MRFIKGLLAVVFAISLTVILLLSSLDVVIYGDMPDFFVNECVKYDVLKDVKVSRADLETVTVQMFDYLKGRRPLLSDIQTTIDGNPDTLFFNEKECRHMEDCRELFLEGMQIRRVCIYLCAGIFLLLLLLADHGVREVTQILAKGMLAGTAVILIVTGISGAAVAANFEKYFTLFHEVFFDNDLWILDPTKDRLLMIMPEGFFMDCVKYAGTIFIVSMAILLVLSAIQLRYAKKNDMDN